MATKNKKSTSKNNKPKKTINERKESTLTPKGGASEKRSTAWTWAGIVAAITVVGVIFQITGVTIFRDVSLSDIFTKPTSTPPYLLVVPPTAKVSTGGGGIYSSDPLPGDTPAPAAAPAQALTPLEFHGNEFTEKQVKCMTPTIIPLSGISNAAFFPGGEAMVLEMKGAQKIAIWDLQKNTSVKTMDGEYLAQSPFGPIFLREGYDAQYNEQIQVVLAKDESVLFGIPGDLAYSVAMSPDGKKLAVGFADEVDLWDITTSAKTVLLGGSAPFFSHNGNIVASIKSGTVYLWDVNTGSLLQTLQQEGMDFTFSLDDKELLYLNGSSVYAWDIASQQTRTILTTQETWSVYDRVTINPSADGKVLAIGSTFWRMPEQILIRHLKEHGDKQAYTVAGSFEGQKLVSVSENNVIVWDLSCSTSSQPTSAPAAKFEKITPQNIASLKVDPTAENLSGRIFTSQGNRFIDEYEVYETNTKKPISSFEGSITSLDWKISPDGKYIAEAKNDNQLSVWDVDNGYLLPPLSGCNATPIFQDDNTLTSSNSKGDICVWKPPYQSAQMLKMKKAQDWLTRLGNRVYEVMKYYNNDENVLAFFDIYSNNERPDYIFQNITSQPEFSPDENYFTAYSASTTFFSVYLASNQNLLKELNTPASFAFSYDGKLFTITYQADDANDVYIYDTSNWQVIKKIPSEPGWTYLHSSVEFTPDGHYLIITDRDGVVTMWSVSQ